MLFSRILTQLKVLRIHGESDVTVSHVTRDSREVRAGTVFCAISGENFDGHTVIHSLNATVLVLERWVDPPAGVVTVLVDDTRVALGVIAALLAGEPSKKLSLVGVTGTNGKTTITTMVDDALNAVGIASGRIGTIGSFVQGQPIPSTLTTPESHLLQKTLGEMVDAGTKVCSLEVSSIGLDQFRVAGCQFQVAVFTNISRDHLDYHGTMEAYLKAKSRLFKDYLRPAGGLPRALVCADDPSAGNVGAPEDSWTYGFAATADVRIIALDTKVNTTEICLETPVGPVTIQTKMLGRHNAQNMAGALAIGLMLGVPSEAFADALGITAFVPGRLERVPSQSGALLVVDYAHTPHALELVLKALREITTGKLYVVFGCGGDRDSGKRREMGRVATQLADMAIVTNDNPRSESPQKIADDICQGVMGEVSVILDRQLAVRRAVELAVAGDTVLVAGKGHETTQVLGDKVIPMDDRLLISNAQDCR